MKTRVVLASLLFTGALAFSPLLYVGHAHAQAASTSTDEKAKEEDFRSRYRIGNNDVISIRVFNEPELSREKIRLNDAGFIQYIALGEVKVLGLTTREVEEIITKALLNGYLKNPRVTVSVDEYRPYFVAGEVGKRGSYAYQPGMTVLRAITIAGGFGPRAAESKIFIRRESEPGVKIKVSPDTSVEPGDIITVEESFF